MPGYTDALKKFRDSGYSGKDAPPKEKGEEEKESPMRMIQLTDDELKSLEPYRTKPGEDIILEVEGRLEDNDFRVMNVKYANGDSSPEKSDSDMLMAKFRETQAPMVQSQTIPSPS